MMSQNTMSTQERQLCEFLKHLPRAHQHRYTQAAENELFYSLFWSLAGGQQEYMKLLFPDNKRPGPNDTWKLRAAQGGADGDEFTEAARGKACGHIFKPGEASYRCKTCSLDDACVLCSRCYSASDHTGHMIYINVSLGNSGCCDCGDPEAWRVPVHCAIHTIHGDDAKKEEKGKGASLPDDLVESIRMTVGRVFDYICDVISCSPEQLRLQKSKATILLDEKMSRLTSSYYNGDYVDDPCEFALLLWNDEKHTINEVSDQVGRACKVPATEALKRAYETDDVGRSIVKYDYDLDALLAVSKIIEQIKVTVTIRSARDTFREQMCGSLVSWLSDIAACSVGSDHYILRQVVCEEMLKPWSTGSEAGNSHVGMKGIDDNARDEMLPPGNEYARFMMARQADIRRQANLAATAESDEDDEQDSDESINLIDVDIDADEDEDGSPTFELVAQIIHTQARASRDGEGDIDMDANEEADVPEEDDALELQEATLAGYPPPPPPPPPAPPRQARDRELTPSDSDTAEIQPLISQNVYNKANVEIPRTPRNKIADRTTPNPPKYWLETPQAFIERDSWQPSHENLWQRLRLDWLILFDLRMWKKVRVGLRDLYISTVVTIPEFKRILGLRFAGLYTTLAQLYLIADREPDHSIINISMQMLTTPSITAEIVERGNFLTNLMAILYTFLTARQVGHPHEVNPSATLAFDSGSVTNRRMYHFFVDLKYLFSSSHVQERLRTDDRYMLQFLDLVKLHQGICPNVRAVGEHIEYETDAWISASLITREVNRLCRQFSEAFRWNIGEDFTHISKAIRWAAKTVILNSIGADRKRFLQAEIKEDIKFKRVGDYEFDTSNTMSGARQHSVIKFVVESQPISFHHALHYTLSWLIECGKDMPRELLTQLLSFSTSDLREKPWPVRQKAAGTQDLTPEDRLIAAFDYPLRVCAWLAQMRAGMWVRNGMSLRHQQGTYRSVNQRDVSHHRDIFLLQTAMVVCPPARVLASIIDRYGLEYWMKGLYEQKPEGVDDGQVLDVSEDLIHLLIVLISDRTSLISNNEESNTHVLAMRRDITHVLCFKPLSFSDICNKLPDKFQEQDECQDILDEMTTFKPPEGLIDVGTFELKEQFMEDIDPYIAHYSKNQREESENAYKFWMAKKTGKQALDIVFEPKLRPIEQGAFSDLSAFTRTGIFAQIIYYALLYPLKAESFTPSVPVTRVEAFLQVVLHLVLIAISEDKTGEEDMTEESLQSFVHIALTSPARSNFISAPASSRTIVAILEMLSQKEVFKACHPKISLVLKRMKQKRPQSFESTFERMGIQIDRISTASPSATNVLEERERKKQAALERQRKVMAQFQEQQKNFMDTQGEIDWGEDEMSDESPDAEDDGLNKKSYFHYPSGNCILCQEETKDGRLYGTFALMTNSSILRQTDLENQDIIREVTSTPSSLDHSAESIRPFGLAGENREEINKVTVNGQHITTQRQFIGKGFPSRSTKRGPISVGCGHIMHYKCFEVYYEASTRRHQHQIARHHPERLEMNEFVCPLCKALGNTFLPVIWAPKVKLSTDSLDSGETFDDWVASVIGPNAQHRTERIDRRGKGASSRSQILFANHNSKTIANPLATKMSELIAEVWAPSSPALAQTPTSHVAFPPTNLGIPVTEIANAIWSSVSARQDGDEPTTTVSPMRELVGIYRRLSETMRKNELGTRHTTGFGEYAIDDFCASDTLARALGYSISAVEIQQRGCAAPLGMTLLETIPQQAITHLRVLSETASSYISIGGIKYSGDNRVAVEFRDDYEAQFRRLFAVEPSQGGDSFTASEEPLLQDDVFVFLTECTICLAQVDEIDIAHLVRLCYLAELVKVIVHISRNMSAAKWQCLMHEYPKPESQLEPFTDFCIAVTRAEAEVSNAATGNDTLDQANLDSMQSCREFVRKYALAFLRKVTVLLNVRYGVTFENHVSSRPDDDELSRLTEALSLPSFDDMCALTNPMHNPFTPGLVFKWVQHNRLYRKKAQLSHPAIFELIGLPNTYDTLMEETMKWRCPSTGKDVSDAMLCLFCGEIFCGQSICCLKDQPQRGGRPARKIGGAQQHMLRCQKNIGLFINVRKCCVYFAYNSSGSFTLAPYIDRYGESDPGLRHSRQLFLHQKRYDAALRTVWLSHGVPSMISRKLEADINNGGWETI